MKESVELRLMRKSSNKFVRFILGFFCIKYRLKNWIELLNHETVILTKTYSDNEKWVMYHDWMFGNNSKHKKHREISFICTKNNFFDTL